MSSKYLLIRLISFSMIFVNLYWLFRDPTLYLVASTGSFGIIILNSDTV
jgi:hypothetical protein